MGRTVFIAFGTLAVGIVLLFGKLGWDEYQQQRPINHVPEVKRNLDSIRLPQPVTLIEDKGTSTNEYAASVWRYYFTQIEPAVLESEFRKQAENLGFAFESKSVTPNSTTFDYENGEYGLRMIISKEPQYGSNLAVSANWYGG